MLFAALSCLQRRGQWEAAQELLQLPVDGLQLTPGNKPDWDEQSLARLAETRTNRHQGHSFEKMLSPVYDHKDQLQWQHGSVHAHENWRELGARGITVETMYPNSKYPYALMTNREYLEAIRLQTPLALDLSHADICISQGLVSEPAVTQLLVHGNIQELHVSYNNGRHDTHSPIPDNYHWLGEVIAWAKAHPDRPVVVECYLHKLSPTDRRRQFDLFQSCRI